MAYQRTKDDLVDELRDQVGFLKRSSESFDDGHEGEAKRLAATLRLMLHDHGRSSKSLLSQLEIKEEMRFLDTAEPINPRNLASTPGLAMMQFTSGGSAGGEGRYVPKCKVPPRTAPGELRFQPWWTGSVAKDGKGELFSRRDFVMTVANKDGGAHVDPSLNAAYAELTRNNSMGWMTEGASEEAPFGGNIAFACVRQIAFEVEQTLQRDLGDLSGEVVQLGRLTTEGVGRNDPCPCGNGAKYKKCHGK